MKSRSVRRLPPTFSNSSSSFSLKKALCRQRRWAHMQKWVKSYRECKDLTNDTGDESVLKTAKRKMNWTIDFFFLEKELTLFTPFLPADDINKWIALLPIEQVERSLVDVNIGEKDRKMANRRDTVAKKCHRNGVSFVAALWQAEIT